MVWRFCHVHIHFAGFGAFSAGNAFVLVNLHLEQGNLVQQGVESTQRTEPFTEWAIEQHAQNYHRNEYTEFPCKQRSQRRPDTRICNGERNSAFQHTLRAKVFAEERIAHTHIVYKERRQQEDHHQQDGVFQVC